VKKVCSEAFAYVGIEGWRVVRVGCGRVIDVKVKGLVVQVGGSAREGISLEGQGSRGEGQECVRTCAGVGVGQCGLGGETRSGHGAGGKYGNTGGLGAGGDEGAGYFLG